MTGLLRWLSGKESACNAGDTGDAGSIPGWEDPLEEEMATDSRILAWEIPWTEEPQTATVHGFAKSWTQLTEHMQTIQCCIFQEFKKLVQRNLCQYVDFIVLADAGTCPVASPHGKGWGE